ncbi:MAG: nucleoside-diphosphate kinase [Bacteroidia bacterium]|nr:nucleoside-diphosphate kinase [Bacteroidia bacterium]
MNGSITFTMIKPSAVESNFTGPILKMINESGFRIKAIKLTKLSKERAEAFYGVHAGKPFFDGLVEFMSSGPIVAVILEKENAIQDFRTLIGSTNPADAAPGTIRKIFAKSFTENAIHGSDSDENALIEGSFFFSEMEQF